MPYVHWPTAALTVGVAAVALLLWFLVWRRRVPARGYVSVADATTYETLHSASEAARHLGDGLSDDGTEKAAPHLRAMLGTPALSICDLNSLVAWDGLGEHGHARHAHAQARRTLDSGRSVVLQGDAVHCTDVDCPIRAAVITPIITDDLVVGTIGAYGPRASAGLVRATEEVATWVAAQIELSELGRERSRAMEAELRALRAQISPHFIYNSLGAIASFVRTDPDRARELLLEFADFTRYALRQGGAYTSLAEELRNVERYLVLEQARFGDRLSISLAVDREVLPVALPYLTIQPLVENAVRHGLAAKSAPGLITLTASDRGHDVEISVEDDGVGADPDHIRRILDGQSRSNSIGLGNVDARLRQVYGDERGLVVETAPDAGMKVSFTVPKYTPGVHVAA
ncbi:sensor histidine kinase [Kribbia dieselivorans]|uniref:sensor histidine kinase n=1 Tax=Kribbia dieselivorans TaxID=331526 RepID=UPI0009FA6B82|nr:histidine kinase [Kribbia dieselivorans]